MAHGRDLEFPSADETHALMLRARAIDVARQLGLTVTWGVRTDDGVYCEGTEGDGPVAVQVRAHPLES